jgi:hypothetical protein
MSGFVATAARAAYTLAFQVSPIILQGGIAAGTPGGMLPIIALTGQLVSFVQGAVTNSGLTTADFFAQFLPIPGATLINNAIGTYPFANQQVAANAIIQQPLNISLLMNAPVNSEGGYLTKLPIFTALQSSLQLHNNSGGTYSIATPAYIYTNCLMTGMSDVTGSDSKQNQTIWQLDFVQPLITLAQAAQAQNGLMSKLTSGAQLPTTPAWSGLASAVGSPVQGALNLVQGAVGLAGATNSFLTSPL